MAWTYSSLQTDTALLDSHSNCDVYHDTIPRKPARYFFTSNHPRNPLSNKYTAPNKDASIFWILLVSSSSYADVDMNTGPRKPKSPCGTCNKAVTRKHKGIRCDNSDCEQWYHIDFQNLRSTIYESLDSSNCSWVCLECALPNLSTPHFDDHSISTSNRFFQLQSNSNIEDPQDSINTDCSPGLSLASSSHSKPLPKQKQKAKPLHLLNINYHSLV